MQPSGWSAECQSCGPDSGRGFFGDGQHTYTHIIALPLWHALRSFAAGRLADQAAALAEIMPKVHYAHSNYQQEGSQGCFLITPKEKGIMLMKNLKEGDGDIYVDMKYTLHGTD